MQFPGLDPLHESEQPELLEPVVERRPEVGELLRQLMLWDVRRTAEVARQVLRLEEAEKAGAWIGARSDAPTTMTGLVK